MSGVTSNFGPPQDLKNGPTIPHLTIYGLKIGPVWTPFCLGHRSCGTCWPIVTPLGTMPSCCDLGQLSSLPTYWDVLNVYQQSWRAMQQVAVKLTYCSSSFIIKQVFILLFHISWWSLDVHNPVCVYSDMILCNLCSTNSWVRKTCIHWELYRFKVSITLRMSIARHPHSSIVQSSSIKRKMQYASICSTVTASILPAAAAGAEWVAIGPSRRSWGGSRGT